MTYQDTARPGREADSFDVVGSVRSLAEAVRHHKLMVAACVATTLAITTLYVFVWPPIYQSEAMVAAERDQDPARDAFYSSWSFFRKEDARTELELMRSGSVLKELIHRENLKYEDVYHPFTSQLAYFWETSWPGRGYKTVKESLFGNEDMAGITPEQADFGRTIRDLYEGISIETVGEANVARVRMKGPSRRVSAITNTLLDVYMEKRSEHHLGEARQAFEILKKEAERARQDLQEVAERRVAFLQEHKLVFDLQKETQEVKNLVELEGSIANTRIKVASLHASLVDVDKQLVQEPPTQKISAVKEQNVLRESAKLKKLELQNQLALTLNRYREDSPEVIELKESIGRLDVIIDATPETVEKSATEGLNSVHQQLLTSRSTLRSELEGHNASLKAMETIGKEMRDRLSMVPDVQNRLKQLDSAYGTAQEKFQALLVKLSQVDVNLATAKATPPSLRIVDYAVPPSSRWWPRLKILYPVALLVGLLLGVAAAQIKRLAGGRVRRNSWGRRTGDALIYGHLVVATYGHSLKVILPGEAEASGEAEAGS